MSTGNNGQTVGYIRVSTVDQNTARQLEGVDVDRLFTDKASGKDTNCLALTECLAYLREGDTLVVHEMSRLARSLPDLRRIVYDRRAVASRSRSSKNTSRSPVTMPTHARC